MPLTFGEVKSRARALIWNEGEREPEELVSNHDQYFKDALVHIQKYIPFYQHNHRDQFPFCSTHFHCGMSVIPAPAGELKLVYTLPDNLDCCEVPYTYIDNYDTIRAWTEANTEDWTEPENKGLPALQFGYKFAESVTDKAWGRAGFGRFTIHHHRIYISPRIESDERIIIEWDGVKHAWGDADEVCDDEDAELVKCVAAFVKSETLTWHSNDAQSMAIARDKLADAMGELYWSARRKELAPLSQMRLPYRPIMLTCLRNECQIPEASDAFGGVLAAAKEAVIGFTSDIQYDLTPAPSLLVEDLIESWTPDAVLTAGDNRSGTILYEDLLAGMTYLAGLKSDDLASNRLWLALGNHDISDGGGITEWYSKFVLPGNKRYYDFMVGACHFFMLNSYATEPDGATSTSAQAQWLRLKMTASKAKWKVVVCHYPPYSSRTSIAPGIASMRWPFKQWGADLVLSGHVHSYERLEAADGLPYIVSGTGGGTLDVIGVPIAESKFQYYANYGAVRIVCGCDRLVTEFFPVGTTTPIDTLTLTK